MKPGRKPTLGPTHAQQIRTAAAKLNRLLNAANEAGWEVEMSLERIMSMSAGTQPLISVGRIYHREGDYAEEVE